MPRGTNAGRRGAQEQSRSLIDLVASLSDSGDYVSEAAIARRFGCEPDQARRLYLLLRGVGGEEGLTLVEDEEGLAVGQGTRGRRLRLTAKETFALLCALDQLGIDSGDPIRRKLSGALSPDGVDRGLLARIRPAQPGAEVAESRHVCSMAIALRSDVAFLYQGARDAEPREREATPLGFIRSEGLWYLEAVDADGARKTFRLDRMVGATLAGRSAQDTQRGVDTAAEKTPRIAIHFDDLRFYDLFFWPRLEVTRRDDEAGTLDGNIPYYGGDWLVRQLAGCGGTVRVDDAGVSEAVREYASAMLKALADQGAGEQGDGRRETGGQGTRKQGL